MRHPALLTASMLLIAASSDARASILSPVGLSRVENFSSVEFVREKRQSETVIQRMKRAWKDLVGYKFDVACPVLLPFSHATCTETGKSCGDARAKCASRNPFCYTTEASC